MANFLFGILLLGLGVSFIIWGNKFNNFMPFEMGRNLVGSGSAAYQILGVILCFVSILFIFGMVSIFG
jgi:hypothetical protein